jgi:hypothetical protein
MENTEFKNTVNQNSTMAYAQKDMCVGHANGSFGIIVSGFVWLFSAFISNTYSVQNAIWALLIGGALISPISIVIEKIMGFKGHKVTNPLKNLAMESTFWMLMCIPLAYGLSLQKTEWFFQGMLLIIGGRYLTFASIYGTKFYWILGATLGISAYLLLINNVQSTNSLLTGASIEIIFGILLLLLYYKNKNS